MKISPLFIIDWRQICGNCGRIRRGGAAPHQREVPPPTNTSGSAFHTIAAEMEIKTKSLQMCQDETRETTLHQSEMDHDCVQDNAFCVKSFSKCLVWKIVFKMPCVENVEMTRRQEDQTQIEVNPLHGVWRKSIDRHVIPCAGFLKL